MGIVSFGHDDLVLEAPILIWRLTPKRPCIALNIGDIDV